MFVSAFRSARAAPRLLLLTRSFSSAIPDVEQKSGVCKTMGAKGFGFIEVPGMENDAFFHRTDVLEGKTVKVGDRVRFQLVDGRNGKPAAANVEVLEKAA